MEREQMTVRLPTKLVERLRGEADRKGFTLHDLLLFILWEGC